jgi:hypothetical protein
MTQNMFYLVNVELSLQSLVEDAVAVRTQLTPTTITIIII